MAGPNTVGEGTVVKLRFVLRGENGEELERSDAKGEAYLHGDGHIPTGLERALHGRATGDKVKVRLSAEDGYGRRKKSVGPQAVPRSSFPADADLKPGLRFTAQGPDGSPLTLFIVRVDSKSVFVDTNHPYAGRTLEYDVEVVSIRPATAKEKRAGAIDG